MSSAAGIEFEHRAHIVAAPVLANTIQHPIAALKNHFRKLPVNAVVEEGVQHGISPAVGVHFKHGAEVIAATTGGGTIQKVVAALRQSQNMLSIHAVSNENMQQGVSPAAGVHFEHEANVVSAARFGNAI